MAKRIKKLTQAQIDRFPEFVEKWTKIGLCTDPADRPEAERGVRLAYEAAGLTPPKAIVWCGSPMSQELTRVIVFGLKEAEIKIGASVWASVGDSVRDSVRASVGASVWASVYGSHDANWLALYDYFGDACQLTDLVAPLHGLNELTRSAGWALPHKGICWVSERHNVLNRDGRGRLHCETGPAVQYPDGWSIYAWHGVRVPEAAIMTPADQISLDSVLTERNVEVARVLMVRAGPQAWRDERVEVMHRDTDGAGQPRELLRIKMPEGQPMQVVRVSCPSTGGEYRLRVPPTVQTCQDAVAWTFRKAGTEYAPALET